MKICKLWADNKPFYIEFQLSFNNEWNNENLYKKEKKRSEDISIRCVDKNIRQHSHGIRSCNKFA